jgi:endo-1,3-1,4-beta-glycanase ExoK
MLNKRSITLFLTAFMIAGAGCANNAAPDSEETTWSHSFKEHQSDLWEISDGYANGAPFDCTWSREQIRFADGTMQLDLTDPGSGDKLCAEYKTKEKYHYGKYEVRMKAASNIGIVSSFFTYTGPAFGTVWDEIDIEFLGKDTTKAQLNYFTSGVGEHEKLIDLGFDAAEEFHDYAFEWRRDSIKWYVDGKLVHTATDDIPVVPGKIMMNLWNGTGVDDWLGAFDGGSPLTAEYEWMKYTPFPEEIPTSE